MNTLRVEIDVADCRISVYNNGDGIPVEFHREERAYVPELIFSHLPTSSKCSNTVAEVTGVKLANIFSTEFIVAIVDGRRMVKYMQVRCWTPKRSSDINVFFGWYYKVG